MGNESISLQFSSGQRLIDDILIGVIGLFETCLPDLAKSYYLSGSYTNNTAVKLSDLDLFIVVKGQLNEVADEKLEAVKKYTSILSPVRLDISLFSDELLKSGRYDLGLVMIKKGGRLLFGNDLINSLPLPDLNTYLKGLTQRAYIFIGWFHPNSNLEIPLQYPDAASEFFGYEYKRVPQWYPPEIEFGTKELVAEVGWIASAIIGLKLGLITGLKEKAVHIYVKQVGGEYANLVEQIYHKCKLEWSYLIPIITQDRTLLRHLCEQMPGFENYFLGLYNEFLKLSESPKTG